MAKHIHTLIVGISLISLLSVPSFAGQEKSPQSKNNSEHTGTLNNDTNNTQLPKKKKKPKITSTNPCPDSKTAECPNPSGKVPK